MKGSAVLILAVAFPRILLFIIIAFIAIGLVVHICNKLYLYFTATEDVTVEGDINSVIEEERDIVPHNMLFSGGFTTTPLFAGGESVTVHEFFLNIDDPSKNLKLKVDTMLLQKIFNCSLIDGQIVTEINTTLLSVKKHIKLTCRKLLSTNELIEVREIITV